LNEKGYYFAVLIVGLYSQYLYKKAVRDKDEGIPVTNIYYGMAFALSLFSAITVQKNVRDKQRARERE